MYEHEWYVCGPSERLPLIPVLPIQLSKARTLVLNRVGWARLQETPESNKCYRRGTATFRLVNPTCTHDLYAIFCPGRTTTRPPPSSAISNVLILYRRTHKNVPCRCRRRIKVLGERQHRQIRQLELEIQLVSKLFLGNIIPGIRLHSDMAGGDTKIINFFGNVFRVKLIEIKRSKLFSFLHCRH